MSTQADRKKWCICQVHRPGFPEAPYYTRLPQYGPWGNQHEARAVSDLRGRLEKQALTLAVRESAHGSVMASLSQIDSITGVDETSLPDQHDTKRNNYEEPLRWQSRVQHD